MIERGTTPTVDRPLDMGELASRGGRSFAEIFLGAANRCLSLLHLSASRGEGARDAETSAHALLAGHESGLGLDEARAAFKALGWRTDGYKGPAHHDPNSPFLTEPSPGSLSLRIDHRVFQPAESLLGEARAIQRTLLDAGGLRDLTPLKLADGLFIVPYRTTERFGIGDTHCGVFKTEDAARNFAETTATNRAGL